MPVNADKPHLWKEDIARSVDFYNDWFMSFAPAAYREQRLQQTEVVAEAMERTNYLRSISPDLLKVHPSVLPMLRMTTAPPIARDRLIGLSYTTPNLVKSMEETTKHAPRVPPRMPKDQLQKELDQICEVLHGMVDRDICPWLDSGKEPTKRQIRRAASVFADRLCGAATDPIIRNAQEREQRRTVRAWLEGRGYTHVTSASIPNAGDMEPGTFTFLYNVAVPSGKKTVNIPIDCVIMPHQAQEADLPIFLELKSAGDFTNPNKRRKEEAQKASQLRNKFGNDIRFVLFLRGYFNASYLGYEAAEGIDWVWEHRPEDLAKLNLDDTDPGGHAGNSSNPDSPSPDDSSQQVKEDSSFWPGKEQERLLLQQKLDSQKTQKSRNQLGQFATPPLLAEQITRLASQALQHNASIDFLEPAFGTGAFFSALLRTLDAGYIKQCLGYEIDPHYGKPAQELWNDEALCLRIDNFTTQEPPTSESERFDLVITNPPYVRHHHLHSDDKRNLQRIIQERRGFKPSGLSGLYAYFVYLAHDWMRKGGIAAWLIPSEFMYVNYGQQLREYLLKHVTLLQVHRFDPQNVQFDDALVSSAVVIFKKKEPSSNHEVLFTYGGSLFEPELSRYITVEEAGKLNKWNNLFGQHTTQPMSENMIRVGDLFHIKRGLATGANKFFILTKKEAVKREIPFQFLKSILPSPRHLKTNRVKSDSHGLPAIEKPLFLLSCDLPQQVIEEKYPKLWAYLQRGIQAGIHERYLCSKRSPWYSQENREPAPLLCTYMGRSHSENDIPFRFILNESQAVVPNVYLNLYPKPKLRRILSRNPHLIHSLWSAFNDLTKGTLLSNGRTYGGGLHKLEPKELANVKISIDPFLAKRYGATEQGDLFSPGEVFMISASTEDMNAL